tara:strand:- start:6903 stop:7952 length:1050 start_codon:yes stop_codon:yes gene_type:complete
MPRKTFLRLALGVVIGIVLLWILFRKTDWAEVATSIRGIDQRWLGLAILCTVANQVIRTQRWSYIVRSSDQSRFRSLFSATQISAMVNFLIPARVGELIRAFVLSQLEEIPLSRSIALTTLDRVYDLLIIILMVLVTLFVFPIDQDVVIGPHTIGNEDTIVFSGKILKPAFIGLSAAFLIAVSVLAFVYFRSDVVLSLSRRVFNVFSEKLTSRLESFFTNFSKGMSIFETTSAQAKCLLLSLFLWAGQVASVACVIAAFGITFAWYVPLFILCATALFIAFPLTPGMIGQFHLSVMISLMIAIPETQAAEAKAVAIVTHMVGCLPLIILGMICSFREGFSIKALKQELA